jgi:hypothetical protein
MSNAARRARTDAIIELLCERFPQTFSRHSPRPLKVGVYADALAALGGAVRPRDGSLLVSDNYAGAIYRIIYGRWQPIASSSP